MLLLLLVVLVVVVVVVVVVVGTGIVVRMGIGFWVILTSQSRLLDGHL